FANEFAHPVARFWFLRSEPDTCCGLRQHHLGQMAVQVLKLGLALEAKHDRIPAFASFADGRVELGQLLQARQFVDHKPHAPLSLSRLVQETYNKPINPQTL